MDKLTTIQIVFIVVAPILVMLLVSIFVVYPLVRKSRNNKYKEYYYRKIYQIAQDKDYLLINNFLFKYDSKHYASIDHILFADKYIYIIIDHFLDGHITGEAEDNEVIINPSEGERKYYQNPLKEVDDIVYKLSVVTGIEFNMMIGIAMINNDVNCSIVSHSKKNYIIQRNNFSKLLKKIESRNIPNLDEEQLVRVANALSKANLRDRNGK